MIRVAAMICLAFCCGAVPLFGQVDPHLQGQPPGLPQVPSAPAAVDTALAVLEFPVPEMTPIAVHTLQDSVQFGGLFHLVLDYEGVLAEDPATGLAAGEEWLVPHREEPPGFLGRIFGGKQGAGPDLSGLPVVEGSRIVRSYRVYRTNPFRVAAGDFTSGVVTVGGRISGPGETAAIRAPRPVGWSPLVVLGLVVALALVLFIAWLLWDRGRRRQELEDRVIPPPAWLAAGLELRDLFLEGSLGRGESRTYLDGLAGIARRFTAGRYRVGAQDMTGREIITACAGLGHRLANPRSLANLIDEVDHRRYDPEPSAPAWCRDQTILLFDLMGRVRVVPKYTEVPVELLLEGEKAWSQLNREFAGTAGRRPAADVAVGKGGS